MGSGQAPARPVARRCRPVPQATPFCEKGGKASRTGPHPLACQLEPIQSAAAVEGTVEELRERPGDDGAELAMSRPDADHLPALLVGAPQIDDGGAAVRQVTEADRSRSAASTRTGGCSG